MSESPPTPCTSDAEGCPRCGRLPKRTVGARYGVVLWPPAGHVTSHVRRIARQAGVDLEPRGGGDALVMVAEHAAAVQQLLAALVQGLGTVEAHGVHVFLGDPDRFGIGDGRAVVPLPDAHARLRADDLIDMMQSDRLRSWMQPIARAADLEMVGAEMLLRGLDADGALVPPLELLDIARRSDLLFQLDLAARRCAIETAAAHCPTGLIFINFTPAAIYDPAFCLRTTVALVEKVGLRPEQVVFEITESEREPDTAHLLRILEFYRSRGFRSALDDVGAGFASLSRLHGLRPDIIKLDLSLVRNADADPVKRVLSRKLVETARELGISTLAEGIEAEAELRFFQDLGVDWVQGNLIGCAAPPASAV